MKLNTNRIEEEEEEDGRVQRYVCHLSQPEIVPVSSLFRRTHTHA